MISNAITFNCDKGRFEVVLLLEQKSEFGRCLSCGGDGRRTFATIKEMVNMDLMELVSTRTRIGMAMKKASLKEMDDQFICKDCAKKKWEITLKF